MDSEKRTFLFGAEVDDALVTDREAWGAVLATRRAGWEEGPRRLVGTLDEVVARQIADDDPPEVWATAQRLLASGLERDGVMSNLVMALAVETQRVLVDEREHDAAAYRAVLDRLPVPDAGEVLAAARRFVVERPGIGIDELATAVNAHLGREPGAEPEATLVELAIDRLVIGDTLVMLHPDRLVDPVSLAGGVVLTHRLTGSERTTSILVASTDLACFAHLHEPLRTSDGVELRCWSGGWGHRSWGGDEGWLHRYPEGALLAVGVEGEVVHIEVLDTEPAHDPGLVAALRAAYDIAVAEPELPVDVGDLVWALVVEDPARFTMPARPLSEMCEAAGLELSEGFAVHDPILWDNQRHLARIHDVVDVFEDEHERRAALDAIDVLDGRTVEHGDVEAAMAGLEPDIISAVASIVLDDDEGEPHAVAEVLAGLLTSWWRPATASRLRWFAAVAAERLCDPVAAVAHLEEAVRIDERFLPAIDRLAWSRSDRGDAAGAARLWRRLVADAGGVGDDLAMVECYAASEKITQGRNERCWCGSGRKYKACHLGRSEAAPLPDRMAWLYYKAIGFTERRGGDIAEDMYEVALLRAGGEDDDELLARALGDPLVIDVVLTELGWFNRFLAERGPLLPDDEALLAQSWSLVDRTLYEVVDVERGVGLTVVDLRTGDEIEVRGRRFSEHARLGWLVCGRAVPDGAGHQFVGGEFVIRPGTEQLLLDLLDERDGYSIIEFVADAERPPVLTTREGEPMVECHATLEIDGADIDEVKAEVVAVLDRLYEAEGAGRWAELHSLDGTAFERVLRATLTLEGRRLGVATTSEARLDRVLGVLAAELPSAKVVADERRPFDLDEMRKRTEADGFWDDDDDLDDYEDDGYEDEDDEDEDDDWGSDDGSALRAAMEGIRDRFERRWCDEPVPALGGLTPRAAVADVTRREEVVRLLASFPEPDEDDDLGTRGGAMMRPARLRELLRLD